MTAIATNEVVEIKTDDETVKAAAQEAAEMRARARRLESYRRARQYLEAGITFAILARIDELYDHADTKASASDRSPLIADVAGSLAKIVETTKVGPDSLAGQVPFKVGTVRNMIVILEDAGLVRPPTSTKADRSRVRLTTKGEEVLYSQNDLEPCPKVLDAENPKSETMLEIAKRKEAQELADLETETKAAQAKAEQAAKAAQEKADQMREASEKIAKARAAASSTNV